MQGRLTEAAALYERALVIDAEIDFRRGVQYALNNLGVVFSEMSDFESADSEFLRSLAISEEIGQTREILHTLCDIADVRAQLGDREEAVRLIAAAFGNPASTQLSVYRAPIHETTERLRARLEDELDENVYRGGVEPRQRRGDRTPGERVARSRRRGISSVTAVPAAPRTHGSKGSARNGLEERPRLCTHIPDAPLIEPNG